MKPATLAELYRQLPRVACKGLCTKACGPVIVGEAEHRKMVAAGGPFTVDPDTLACGYLEHGRCRVYAVRPYVCRAYGASEDLACPYGCATGELMTEDESTQLFRVMTKMVGKSVWPTYERHGKTYVYRPLPVVSVER